jgi:GAF domain-containing protein
MHDDLDKQPKTLQEAQRIIDRQEAEIEHLRRGLGDERVAEDLRNALRLATTAGTIASPLTHHQLLTRIVETAAKVINARYGSLFLLDEETHELIFEVSLRESVEELKQFRVPLGHGIAGLVAATGQPMAISDAATSDLHASDLASDTGYMPESILCVPLNHNDQVIGVLQLLDKNGSESFAADDMERLGLFANLVAITIEQSRTQHSLVRLLGEVLIASGGSHDEPSGELRTWVDSFAREIEDESAFRHALDLARLVHEITQNGDHELAATRAILEAFAAYLRTRPKPELMFGTHG